MQQQAATHPVNLLIPPLLPSPPAGSRGRLIGFAKNRVSSVIRRLVDRHPNVFSGFELAPHNIGRHTLLDGMAQPHHHSYHGPYALEREHGRGHYIQEQALQQQSQITQLPRLPPMSAMISTVASSHHAALPDGREAPYPGRKRSYYADYPTPSLVGKRLPSSRAPTATIIPCETCGRHRALPQPVIDS
ncbi:hypothetical protein VTK56DRAFT_3137 [Thermocarpiscus australiensis]